MAQNIRNVRFTANFTRPANTTAYAAEDAVNDNTSTPHIMEFVTTDTTGQHGQDVIFKTLRVTKDSNTTTNASFRLYLTKETQTIAEDNTAQTLLYANRSNRIGYIDFTFTTGGTGSNCAEAVVTDVNIPHRLLSAKVYGYLVAKAAYTPASGEKFDFELMAHITNG